MPDKQLTKGELKTIKEKRRKINPNAEGVAGFFINLKRKPSSGGVDNYVELSFFLLTLIWYEDSLEFLKDTL